jgi:hypothetical protein
MNVSFGLSVFQYAAQAHTRRHGPTGYDDYRSYKPWLRDEFAFRCVFCLTRERWCHDGSNGFGVDHFFPKSARPDLLCDYDNLLYLCNRCNVAKRISAVLNPCMVALGDHLRVDDDGSVVARTKEGEHVIDAFNLNYSIAREYRRRKIDAFSRWRDSGDEFTIEEELAFPDDLPQLDDRRCSNRRPEGIAESYFSLRQRGLLPAIY